MKPKKLIKVIGVQFGGVGVSCHQPLGSKTLVCPYDRDNPFPYQPAFQGFGDHEYSGDFECEPSDSIQAEANTIIPDASQFLSADQIDQIEQMLKLNDYGSNSLSAVEFQGADALEPLPVSESDGSFQLLDAGLEPYVDENASGSQWGGSETFSNTKLDTPVSDQDSASIDSPDYSLFTNDDIFG